MLIFQNTIEKNLFLFKFIQISTAPYIHIRNNSNNFREYPLWIIIQKYQNQISTYSKQFLFQIPNSFFFYSITSYLYKPFFQTLKPLINIRSDSRALLSLLAHYTSKFPRNLLFFPPNRRINWDSPISTQSIDPSSHGGHSSKSVARVLRALNVDDAYDEECIVMKNARNEPERIIKRERLKPAEVYKYDGSRRYGAQGCCRSCGMGLPKPSNQPHFCLSPTTVTHVTHVTGPRLDLWIFSFIFICFFFFFFRPSFFFSFFLLERWRRLCERGNADRSISYSTMVVDIHTDARRYS